MNFLTKMVHVFCFSFIVNCAKADAPIKGPKHVFNIGTYRPVKRVSFIGCCLDDKQSPFIYKYNLSQKTMSTFIVLRRRDTKESTCLLRHITMEKSDLCQ